jgi:hypothetical protein
LPRLPSSHSLVTGKQRHFVCNSVVVEAEDILARLCENALPIKYDYLARYVADHVALISHTARQRLTSVWICLIPTIGKSVSDGFEFDAKTRS